MRLHVTFTYLITTIEYIQDLFKSCITGLNDTLQDAIDIFELSHHLFVIVLLCAKIIYLSHKTIISAILVAHSSLLIA